MLNLFFSNHHKIKRHFAILHTTITLPQETLLNTKTYYHTMSGPESKRR